jgi:hypothetical protein
MADSQKPSNNTNSPNVPLDLMNISLSNFLKKYNSIKNKIHPNLHETSNFLRELCPRN